MIGISNAFTIDDNLESNRVVMKERSTELSSLDVGGEDSESSLSFMWGKFMLIIHVSSKQDRGTFPKFKHRMVFGVGITEESTISEVSSLDDLYEEGEVLLTDGSILITDPDINVILERSRADIKAARTVPWSQVKRGILH